ncbi:GDP-mannose pyrophosphatase NudK [Xanthomonas graminis]|uniref:GDP-mannose pyrophosphatase NudK n=1 Tax=Xanthomonas graminis TaxID=3390026 RepID=UPI000587D895|nr:GDP-mannose pyrophosphatase NudK [Xanthomonas translucens]OAX59373.1 GDP-mannose pyrophosphatase [Xanthomonas translucens pv. graminis]UKE55427.1 GDP-mannose pyrophosphatase NudK [Xanthomonas translucens pv. graminis]WIH09802.1 GDP-mannose pyrophosphatase NudK [Xanthomonas translucens pv. graminis]WIH11464.1 GDP-mannose pyrophosphatase NudK [Xanthomonas translucens pv. graminis]WIH15113.1 GDP-mannose pyrophosphatase NudK [Xanthomonas translucens pv. graminis]
MNPFPAGNPRVRIRDIAVLSDNWYVLRKVTFDFQRSDGSWQTLSREAYDRGNGATILLYSRAKQTVLLTRQFRLPTLLNGNPDGMLIEACAGLLDQHDAQTCIRKETEEETGYRIENVRKVFEAFMSPGSVTERLYFFVGEYFDRDKVGAGGGVAAEGEEIEVLELTLDTALAMIESGAIADGKTIMLLQYAKLHGVLG